MNGAISYFFDRMMKLVFDAFSDPEPVRRA